MTKQEELEDAVIARLLPIKEQGVEVVYWPDTEEEYNKAFAKARLSVVYHSATGSEQLATDTSTAEKETSIQIHIEAKRKRGVLGIYDLAAQAEGLLVGLVVPGFKRFVFGSLTQSDREIKTGVWAYNLIVKTTGVIHQSFDDNTPKYNIPGLPGN